MSCIAPVVDATSSRLDFAATSSHTAPWSARAAMPVATRACAARFFIARSAAPGSDSPRAGRRGRAAPRTAAATQRTFAAERVPGGNAVASRVSVRAPSMRPKSRRAMSP